MENVTNQAGKALKGENSNISGIFKAIGKWIARYGAQLCFLAILFLVLAFSTKTFFTAKNLINVMRQVSINVFVACAMTMILIAGGIDLSIGAVMATTGMVAAYMSLAGISFFLCVLAIFLFSVVLGWLPADTRNFLDACGVVKMGVTELFALLFILYEATSVLKNMLLCGLPVPAGLREKLGAWLSTMTEETNVDIVAEKVTPAPIEDDREESGLLDE